jgi:hypothetical protein
MGISDMILSTLQQAKHIWFYVISGQQDKIAIPAQFL